jgi:rhamnulose-1-phosphate aldolase
LRKKLGSIQSYCRTQIMGALSLDDIVEQLADIGQRLAEIQAIEGAAGNISVFTHELAPLAPCFVKQSLFQLPVPAAALKGGWLVVSGSGRRLRDIGRHPTTTLCVLHLDQNGTHATLYAASDLYPSSELNSHLAIHSTYCQTHNPSQHVVLHAQPPYLTYLSHIMPAGDTTTFNRRLLRWQPETILVFPEGIGLLPFQVPGSPEQATLTASATQLHRAVVWQQHGIIVRADSVAQACDLIQYAEAAARYEYLNLQAGEPAAGLSEDQLRHICEHWDIVQGMF